MTPDPALPPGDPAPEAITPPPGSPAAPEQGAEDHVIAGHRYDGIREYDNPMPRWWVWLFWATILWTPVYILGVHVFGFIPTYGARLEAQTTELEAVRTAYAAASPAFSTEPAALATYTTSADNAAAGAALYPTAGCPACHGDKLQGVIGPNLTDEYWLHGAKPEDVFGVLTNGVLEKGMPPQTALSEEQRAQLVAYIFSLKGSNPPGAKEPQGDKVEG